MPPISHYLEYKNEPDNWICLHAYYTVSSMSNDDTAYPIERELWSFIQAFLVDKEHRKEMCELIDKEGIAQRIIKLDIVIIANIIGRRVIKHKLRHTVIPNVSIMQAAETHYIKFNHRICSMILVNMLTLPLIVLVK